MIFLLNIIRFLAEMIICPILMIPFLIWRLLISGQQTDLNIPPTRQRRARRSGNAREQVDLAQHGLSFG